MSDIKRVRDEDCPLCNAPLYLEDKAEVVFCISPKCGYYYKLSEDLLFRDVEDAEDLALKEADERD